MATPFEIVGAFHDERRARRVADDLASRGLPRRHLRLVEPMRTDETRTGEMRAEMQQEVSEGLAGPGAGFLTPSQTAGAVRGIVIGGSVGLVIGVLVGLVWGFITDSAISPLGRVAITAVCFAVAGGTAGIVAGGSLKPRAEGASHPGRMLDERRLAAETDTLLEVHVNDEREATMVKEVLRTGGAERVDALDVDGNPLPPQDQHPRPADPPDYWKNGDKRG